MRPGAATSGARPGTPQAPGGFRPPRKTRSSRGTRPRPDDGRRGGGTPPGVAAGALGANATAAPRGGDGDRGEEGQAARLPAGPPAPDPRRTGDPPGVFKPPRRNALGTWRKTEERRAVERRGTRPTARPASTPARGRRQPRRCRARDGVTPPPAVARRRAPPHPPPHRHPGPARPLRPRPRPSPVPPPGATPHPQTRAPRRREAGGAATGNAGHATGEVGGGGGEDPGTDRGWRRPEGAAGEAGRRRHRSGATSEARPGLACGRRREPAARAAAPDRGAPGPRGSAAAGPPPPRPETRRSARPSRTGRGVNRRRGRGGARGGGSRTRTLASRAGEEEATRRRPSAAAFSLMILPQVHLRKPCYDFYFL